MEEMPGVREAVHVNLQQQEAERSRQEKAYREKTNTSFREVQKESRNLYHDCVVVVKDRRFWPSLFVDER
jgi:hypothetical protein